MTTFAPKQITAANWLLRYSRGKPEDFIRKRIGELLGSLDVEYEMSYPTDAGPADIYLPRRRTIIETKASGLADDPDRAQARKNEKHRGSNSSATCAPRSPTSARASSSNMNQIVHGQGF